VLALKGMKMKNKTKNGKLSMAMKQNQKIIQKVP